MLTLGIETSGSCGGISICRDSTLIAKLALSTSQTHSRRLVPSIKWLMERSGIGMDELQCVAVSIGPGSFTGLRIGLSTARGFAISLGIDISGVPTLDVLAAAVPPLPDMLLFPLIDARNSRFYTACYAAGEKGDAWTRVSPFMITTAGKLHEAHLKLMAEPDGLLLKTLSGRKLPSIMFTGDALATCGEDIRGAFSGSSTLFTPEWMWHPDPSLVAALAGRFLLPQSRQDSIVPLYVKLSQAEERRQAAGQ